MSRPARLLSVVAASLLMLLAPSTASAHPLGNFTVNVYAGIEINREEVIVDYVVDMAEIPTFQTLPAIDADDDGRATAEELARWASQRGQALADAVDVSIDGDPVEVRPTDVSATLAQGQGGLRTLRLEILFWSEAPAMGTLVFRDGTFADRIGWREVTATAANGTTIASSSVPESSASQRLRAYPESQGRPLDVREATVVFVPGRTDGSAAAVPDQGDSRTRQPADDGFAGLLSRGGSLAPAALLLAVAFGAIHALGPGHGKALAAAYLLGSGARLADALRVGLSVAGLHTASVMALGLAAVSAQRWFPVERTYSWLGVVSGVAAFGLGSALLCSRIRGHRAAHEHADADPHGHPSSRRAARGIAALAVAGGVLPSPTALVVLLASLSLGRVSFGLALIAAFSLGLAIAVTAVGAIAVRTRRVLEHHRPRLVDRIVPIGSAAGITVMGAVLAARGLAGL